MYLYVTIPCVVRHAQGQEESPDLQMPHLQLGFGIENKKLEWVSVQETRLARSA